MIGTLLHDDSVSIERVNTQHLVREAFDDPEFPALSDAVNHFKNTKEGFGYMCQLTKELREEGIKEGKEEGRIELIIKMIKNNLLSVEDAVRDYGFNRETLLRALSK